MFRRIIDWVDEFTGYDRRAVRVLLGIALAFAVWVGVEWTISGGVKDTFFPNECDAACHQRIQDAWERRQIAGPFDPERTADEIIRDVIQPTAPSGSGN